MPIDTFENELTVQLWQPVTIRGFTFNVGDNLTLDRTKVAKTEADGGNFAWLSRRPRPSGPAPVPPLWNRLPPPLSARGRRCRRPG